jgi:hypothetical protein
MNTCSRILLTLVLYYGQGWDINFTLALLVAIVLRLIIVVAVVVVVVVAFPTKNVVDQRVVVIVITAQCQLGQIVVIEVDPLVDAQSLQKEVQCELRRQVSGFRIQV